MGFINVIRKTQFTRANAYLAYLRSGEVDWDAVDIETPFIVYKVDTGDTFEVPTAEYQGRYPRVDGTGSSFSQFELPMMQRNWLPAPVFSRSQ